MAAAADEVLELRAVPPRDLRIHEPLGAQRAIDGADEIVTVVLLGPVASEASSYQYLLNFLEDFL
ncbi:MAG TPA: hypothetical protein VIE64_08180 [Solirubrobacterales bacterium]